MKTAKKILAFVLSLAMFVTCVNVDLYNSMAVAETTTDGKVTITVNYVYESNQALLTQPYKAQVAKGSDFKKTIDVQSLLNYKVPVDKATVNKTGKLSDYAGKIDLDESNSTLTFNLSEVTEDLDIVLYYVAGTATYTVKHYYQNLENDDYAEPRIVTIAGDIDAYTDAIADSKHGYRCKGVPQYTIAADGTTIVEIYYDRIYYTVVFDVNGGVNGPEPIYAKYGTTFDSSTIQKPTRTGYNFSGWGVDDSKDVLSGMVIIENNITYTAKWDAGRTNADYTIVIWGQNADDDNYSYINSYGAWGNVGNKVKWDVDTPINHTHGEECYKPCDKEEHTHNDGCYSCTEHTHDKSCYAGVGDPVWFGSFGMPSNPSEGQVYVGRFDKYIYVNGTWYEYTGSTQSGQTAPTICEKTEHTHGDGNCVYGCSYSVEHTHTADCKMLDCTISTADKLMGSLHPGSDLWIYEKSDEVTVDADGSTVLNVYFKRKAFTLHFRRANSVTDNYGTITARWGQNIVDEYQKVVNEAGDSFWSEKSNAGSPWTVYVGIMPKRDIVYYLKTDSSSRKSTMTYYGENLNGQYEKIFSVTFNGTSYTVTVEDRYEFEGYTYDHGTAIGTNCSGAEFYYKRNKYNLDFYSKSKYEKDKTESVLYQKGLGEYDYVPTNKPDSVESDSVFAGWYLNPECTGEQYILNDHKMPANNVALYAKWVNARYTVKTYTDDSLSELYTYDGYTGVQEDIEKYKYATAPTDPKKTDFEFVGWFYKDEDGKEQAFSFTMNITKDYNLYPKWVESLYVEYKVHYYLDGTTTKLADDRVNSVYRGNTVTEKAKMGTELNLADSGKTYFLSHFEVLKNGTKEREGVSTSTSEQISLSGVEIIFYYKEATDVKYTVYYREGSETGKDLATPKQETTNFSTITEYPIEISGYECEQYSASIDLVADESKNVIIFVYNRKIADLTITKKGVADSDKNLTFMFKITAINDDGTNGRSIIVTVQGENSVTIKNLSLGKYKIEEISGWSWRYEFKSSNVDDLSSVELTADGKDVIITNERKNDHWLDDETSVDNIYKAGITQKFNPAKTEGE